MPEDVKAVAVDSDALRVRVAPTVALRTAWKTTALQAISGGASIILLVLGYLGSVNLQSVLPPDRALLWIVAINVAQLVLRAFGVKPIVLDPPADITVKRDAA